MRSRDDLFQLIKAMSRSEKRYFVLDAKKSGRRGSRYLHLFDALSNMEEFDEVRLKKLFPKNLSSDKAYLYEAILRSMRDYRSASSKAAQVKERLMDARFLHERGLYEQSNQRILEAKQMSRELEDNFSLLEIVREEQLSLYDRRVKVGIEQVEELQREIQAVLLKVKEELDYIDLYFRLAVEVSEKGGLRDKESIAKILENIPSYLLEQKNRPISPLASRRRFLSLALYNRLIGERDGIYENCEKVVTWWDGYPALKKEAFYRYVGDVTNLVKVCYTHEKLLPKAAYWYKKLQTEAKGRNYHEKKYVFLSLSVANLLNFMNMGDREGTIEALPQIIAGLDEFGLKRSVLLLINIVIAYFWVEDYAECENWCNQFIDLKGNSREDIRRIVVLFRLIALFEQGKVDKVETGFRSADRMFKKLSVSKLSFDYIMLNRYLKKILNAPLNEFKPYLKELQSYLQSLEEDNTKKLPIGFGEIKMWTQQKLGQ